MNVHEIDAQVALDCIRIIRGEVDRATTDTLEFLAHIQYPNCLVAADLAYLSPKLKSDIGRHLVPMFYGNKVVEIWRFFGGIWIVEDQQEAAILKWFSDAAAMKSVSTDADTKAWIDSVTSNINSEHDLLEHVAKAAAKTWLLGHGCEDLSDMLEEPFRFVRGYHNKASGLSLLYIVRLTKEMQIKRRKDPLVKKFTWEDYWGGEFDEDLSELLSWADEHEITNETTYVLCFRLAETYRMLKNYDEAKELLKRAIHMQLDDSKEAQRSLAKLYSQKNEFNLAVETMQPVVERLKTLSDPTEKQQERLIDCLEDIATWNKRDGKYDEAVQIYQEILRQDAENYRIVCEILSVLADQNVPQQIIDHLKSLGTETDTKTGNDRLTQLLFTCADSEEVYNIISHSARELKRLNLIREIYEKAIEVAEKEKAASSSRDNKQAEVIGAIVQLKNHLANSLHRHNENEADTKAAVELWKEITTLQVNTRLHWAIYDAKRSAAKQVCLYYMAEARRRAFADPDAAHVYVNEIESLLKGLSGEREKPLEDYEIQRMLGYHLASIGQQEQARAHLNSTIKLGVELLSDEDDTNNFEGYIKLADAFMRLKDKDNALAAWSLLGPNNIVPQPPAKASPDSTSRPPDVVVSGTSFNALEITGVGADGAPAAIETTMTVTNSDPTALDPLPRGLTRRTTSDLAKKSKALAKVPPKGPLGFYCHCHRPECLEKRGQFTFADDFYYCRQCPDIQFTPECLELLRQGKIRRHICDKDHDFFHVPPWDFEKAWKVGKGNVQVGEKVITVQDWLNGIRRDWGIEQKNSGGAGEGEKGEKEKVEDLANA